MKPLSGLDALFLHLETPETPMHVGALQLLELPPHYEGDFLADLRRHVESRLPVLPLFTRRLAPMPLGLANPAWVEADVVDLEYHIRRVRLPGPGNHSQLEATTAKLHARRLDRDRPLWEFHLIEGLKSGQRALYIKIHHATLDGAAGVAW